MRDRRYRTHQERPGGTRVYNNRDTLEEARDCWDRFSSGPLEIFERTEEVNSWDIFNVYAELDEGLCINEDSRDGRLAKLLDKWGGEYPAADFKLWRLIETLETRTEEGGCEKGKQKIGGLEITGSCLPADG